MRKGRKRVMAKRLMTFIVSVLLLFVISACGASYNNDPQSGYADYIAVNYERPTIFLTNEDLYSQIIASVDVAFINPSGSIFASSPEMSESWGRFSIHRFYEESGASALTDIYAIDNAFWLWDMVAFGNDGDFFMPVAVNTEGLIMQKIIKFNAYSPDNNNWPHGHSQGYVIREMEPAVYLNLFVHDDYMIIFEPRFDNNEFIYQISKLRLYDKIEVNLIERSYSIESGTGEVISNIFVDNGLIFLYRMEFNEGVAEKFFIDKYDFDGNLIYSFELDIEGFLYMKEVSDMDSVFEFFKFGDYFVLRTIHNRIKMYRLEDGRLFQINVPASLQRLGAASVINIYQGDSPLIYFWHYIDNALYIYDMLSQNFYMVYIERKEDDISEFLEGWAHRVRRDEYGNLLLQIRADMGAYRRWRQELEQSLPPGQYLAGGARFMPGDSFFYEVCGDVIRDSMQNK